MLNSINNGKEWKDFIKQFSIRPLGKDHKDILRGLKSLVIDSVKKNIPDEKFGLLFSGGVDSTTIAQVCSDEGKDFICYTAAFGEEGLKQAEDLTYAKKAAKKLGLNLKIKTINLNETERYIEEVLNILNEPDVVKVGVALPFYICFEMAKKDGVKVMFSGLGSEELFAGYERHSKARDVNKECFKGLLNMYERDITRDLAIAKAQKVNLRVPFLDSELIEYSLKIPGEFKLSVAQNKMILREVAEQLGLREFAWRKKRAAQYGSRFANAIEKLAKKSGFKYKRDYLKTLLNKSRK